ncbi:rod shape-determining protein, partial [Blautia schinkii]|uniref:rod shape-determining protein n=1 Tax=Blautia schinkii TaxID=180164 RepID=UPI0023B064F8
PELAADIVDRGIVLAGGGALLRAMDALIEQRTGVNTLTVQNAMQVVAVGTGKYAEIMSRMNLNNCRQEPGIFMIDHRYPGFAVIRLKNSSNFGAGRKR